MKAAPFGILLASSLHGIFSSPANGQPAETKAWPEADFHVELRSRFRILGLTGLEQGVGYPFQEWYAGAGLGYQFKPILKSHIENIDPDKEHHLVFGGGYEHFQTIETGKVTSEERAVIEISPGLRPLSWLLLRDRNRIEFRWIDGAYSTRYRNEPTIEADAAIHGYHFVPFGSAEVFYNGKSGLWDQEWYTAGAQWPHKHFLMVETYYRREHCPTCKPVNWNTGEITVHLYFRNAK